MPSTKKAVTYKRFHFPLPHPYGFVHRDRKQHALSRRLGACSFADCLHNGTPELPGDHNGYDLPFRVDGDPEKPGGIISADVPGV